MRKKYHILFLLFIFIPRLYSQDTALFKYFPLKINNLWVYYATSYSPMGYAAWYDKYKVTSSVIINNKTYFITAHTRIMIMSSGLYDLQSIRVFKNDVPLRFDSVNMNIYKNEICNAATELLVDSLRAKLHDTSSTCDAHGNHVTCIDTTSVNIFNAYRPAKRYQIMAFEGGNLQQYVKNIGVTDFDWQQLMSSVLYNIRGCYIDGVLYGDTNTIVSIQNISKEIPEYFSLSQNYPNPFNPITKIKFDVPLDSRLRGNDNVTLKIYDVLGREIATLVNEPLSPGTYEIEWDGTNYTSGVYFYKLVTADFSETRKMVLIK